MIIIGAKKSTVPSATMTKEIQQHTGMPIMTPVNAVFVELEVIVIMMTTLVVTLLILF